MFLRFRRFHLIVRVLVLAFCISGCDGFSKPYIGPIIENNKDHGSLVALLKVRGRRNRESVTITAPFYYHPEQQQQSSLLHDIHIQPCLSVTEAARCLQLAKEHAAATGCWDQSSGRHINYNTVDFEVEESEELSNYLNDISFHNRIIQQLSDAFEIEEPYITFLDLFCSNYEASAAAPPPPTDQSNNEGVEQSPTTMDSLVMHRDGSLLSFTVLLSDPQMDFEGGGTTFECLKNVDVKVRGKKDASTTSSSSSVLDPDEAYQAVVRFCRNNGTVQPQRRGYCTLHSGKMLHGADIVTRGSRCVLVGFMDVAPFITDPGRLGEACKQWGRLDEMRRRYQWQQKKLQLTTKSSWSLQHAKFLPQKNISHLPTLGIPFPSVKIRADENYQRQHRLMVEDWFLREALLPPDQRDPSWMLGDHNDDGIIIL